MNKKWRIVSELLECIANDDLLDSCSKNLTCITYAPNVGYRSWIFLYKGILVALWDMGNCHWGFHSTVTLWDLIVAKWNVFKDVLASKKR